MARRVLLIADLEGITGVDSIDALAMGSLSYPAAAQRMTDEVAFVARQLVLQGVETIVVSDAHRSGAATNLDAGQLPAACEVRVEDDMYGGTLLDGVESVVCVGMHAQGPSPGFGAHTVSVNTAWTLGSLALTETHLALLLAAERGIPMWCSSGCDVLEAQLGGLVPFVRTKHSVSRSQASSLPQAEVEARLLEVLRGPPAALPSVPREVLRVRFQKAAEAERSGGKRSSPTEVELPARASFQQQYDEALSLIGAAEAALHERVTGLPGTPRFAASAAELLLQPWED